MKKALLSFSVLGTLALASCDKVKDAIFPAFETSINDIKVTVPVTTNTTTEMSLGEVVVNFNVDSVIRKHTADQFSIDNAKSIQVVTTTIDVLNGTDENNISNFESVKLSVSSNTRPTPVAIASAIITSAVEPLVINGNGTDLKEYLKAGRMTYTLSGKAKKPTTQPLQLEVSLQLKVN